MSRTYDALQRADLERKTAPASDADALAEAPSDQNSGEARPAKTGVDFDHVQLHPWNPSMSSFPTLADRGESSSSFAAFARASTRLAMRLR